ncbi:mechanosensitive ion channel [Maricaulis sp. CAU 1757]
MEEFWNNFVRQVEVYGPNLLTALLVLAGFILAAFLVRWLVVTALARTGMIKKASEKDPEHTKGVGRSIGAAVFWLIILIGLVQALAIAGLTRISRALDTVIGPIMEYLPNIFGAVIVFAIFIIVANVVKSALQAILTFTDGLPQRFGLAQKPVPVAHTSAVLAYSVVLILGAITAFDILDIEAISGPANALLWEIVAIIPNLIAAIIILAIFVLIAKFVADLLKDVLSGTSLDSAAREVGILDGTPGNTTASNAVAKVAQFFIVLLGLVTALSALGIPELTNAMATVLKMGAQIIFGAFIILVGLVIAKLVAKAMAATGSGSSDVAATAVKWIISILAVILGISRMGLDPSDDGSFVLDAARILLLGASVAGAIAFGWGGRHWAARQLERFAPDTQAEKPVKPSAKPRASRAKKSPPPDAPQG